MKVVIESIEFEYNTGIRLLKLKYNECPFPELADIWDQIQPMKFSEIAMLSNMEERRVGILCLGLERLVAEVKPKLLNRQIVKKTTAWVMPTGIIKIHKFKDTYELYEVSGDVFSGGKVTERMDNCYFVKFKDTSTPREYFIWVDVNSVYSTNYEPSVMRYGQLTSELLAKVNAIQAIAWTIQTDIPQGNIEKIVRQGDCILIKPKGNSQGSVATRHLTEKEYRELLVAES